MIEEIFPDTERQLLVVLAMRALIPIQDDPDMREAIDELKSIIAKLVGVDTVLLARRAYPSGAKSATPDLYHDPRFPVRQCDNEKCRKEYRGASVYCSLKCALDDA